MGWRKMRVGTAVAAGTLLAGMMTVPAHALTMVGCSETELRDAITASNGMLGGDTLQLTSYCVYTLTDTFGQLPTLIQPLVIVGNNATIRRDPTALSDYRLFQVTTGGSLDMSTLTLMNGSYGPATVGGGAVAVTEAGGPLITNNVNFQGNRATGRGGAVYLNTTSAAPSSITGGTFSDNMAMNIGGGGIFTQGGTLTVDSATMTRNRAGFGGGIYADGTKLTVEDSIVSNNTGVFGGGGIILLDGNAGTPVNITDTAITDNSVTGSAEGGGGIVASLATGNVTTITDSTISGNTVTGYTAIDGFGNRGGGINKETGTSGQLILDNTDVTANRIIGASGQGAGIAAGGGSPAGVLTLRNGTSVTRNLASGRYSQGGGLYTENGEGDALTVAIDTTSIDTNKVTGTGSAAAGIYNLDATVSLNGGSVSNNTAPAAPAPGGISTVDVPISSVTGTTITGNTPTNCLLSPMPVATCMG
ncbi:hypothetical protein [Streptomyces sp. NPDC086787]|uniref:hypothetical protein n=1 Tax=Streptomyces sp. NPDC086787 TaxID=3365759 RepID=UPI003822924B